MAVSTTTFIQDSVKFIRDDLLSNVTDPISATRPSTSKFVLTSYPSRPSVYPIITIRNEGPSDIVKSGMRSELRWATLLFEVRIWARSETEKDTLTQQVINRFRNNQYDGGASSSDDNLLHDFDIVSTTPIDEEGEQGVAIKSMVMRVSFKFMLGE